MKGVDAIKGRCRTAFHQGNQDRWGNALQSPTIKIESPGPGAFYGESAPEHRNPFLRSQKSNGNATLTSAFRSGSQRLKAEAAQAPGPAYYKSEAPSRKTFYFNHMKRWV